MSLYRNIIPIKSFPATCLSLVFIACPLTEKSSRLIHKTNKNVEKDFS